MTDTGTMREVTGEEDEADAPGANPWLVIGAAILASALIVCFAIVIAHPGKPNTTQFTDQFGRACLTVTSNHGVDADCDYPPLLRGNA